MYLADLCDGCGQPRHRSMNPDMGGWYEVRTAQCNACAELDNGRKAHKEFDRSVKEFVVDTRPMSDPPREWHLDLAPSSE